jgi:hypothetical protein
MGKDGSGSNGNVNAVEPYAKLKRKVVLHRMDTADCLDDRLYWAIILWGPCGPDVSPDGGVYAKDPDGRFCRDPTGNLIPATQKHLRELLGLAPAMAGAVCRAIERLYEKGSIAFGEKLERGVRIIYHIQEPTRPAKGEQIAGTGNLVSDWHISKLHIGTGNLPTDQIARTAAILWLNQQQEGWRTDLKALRYRYQEETVQGCRERGILISLNKPINLQDHHPAGGRAAEVVTEEPAPAPPEPPARPPDGSPQESQNIRPQIRAHLLNLAVPSQLREIDFERIAQAIGDEKTFELFRKNTENREFRKWSLVITVAEETRERAKTYPEGKAAAAGASNRHQEWLDRMKRKQEQDDGQSKTEA